MKDLIWTQKNSLTSDFCRNVIQKFESDQRKHPGKVIGDDMDSNPEIKYKVSTDLYITPLIDWEQEDTIFYQYYNQQFRIISNIASQLIPN